MENKKEENKTRSAKAQKRLQKLVIEKLSWRINNSSSNAGDTDWTSERAKSAQKTTIKRLRMPREARRKIQMLFIPEHRDSHWMLNLLDEPRKLLKRRSSIVWTASARMYIAVARWQVEGRPSRALVGRRSGEGYRILRDPRDCSNKAAWQPSVGGLGSWSLPPSKRINLRRLRA
ncbi:hypothetical protein TSAR_005832 [Trichomalopsis sarcophagae]|uniref:Uncharacterized protein n=1 Tax=Trichomalopsis sarcophagae TaxID=543379 RepID=A0A232EVQ5_9HYME|nr:hypothetical protein TSAR_005832 [Trichomalopsis sarcophagae]